MNIVDVIDIKENGFHPAIIYETWKVSIFNDDEKWKEKNICYLQKHNLSDETFILLEGKCTLLLSNEEIPTNYYGLKLEKGKVYNIPKGVWHSHVLTENTKLIVVENSNTVPENSPKVPLPVPLDLKKINYLEM